MKLDKELLIKHRFWVILGGFVFLWVIALLTLLFGSSGPIQAKKQEYEAAKQSVSRHMRPKQASPPDSNPFLKPWVTYGERFKKHKDEIWQQAWQLQKDMITWPSSPQAPLQAMWDRADSFEEWLKTFSQEPQSTTNRRDYKDKLYLPQFADLDRLVEPIQFKDGKNGFNSIMAPETGSAAASGSSQSAGQTTAVYTSQASSGGGRSISALWQETPTTEECWLAQEDLWVKTEMLKILRATLDRVGRFERLPLDKDDALPAGVVARHRFRNRYWELDLLVERTADGRKLSSKSTIKNVHPSRRPLYLANPRTKEGVAFRLIQNDLDYLLRVKGEPLPWNQSTDFKEELSIDTINPEKPFEVVQVFDWDTSPIRRIDQLRTGFHSHRTANVPLVASKKFQAAQPGTGTAGMGQPLTDPAMMSSDPAMSPGGMPPGQPGAAAPGSSPATELNGLLRNRYVSVTDQCRHLPVAMALVIEQSHVHNLLAEVVSSPLRIQVTQVQVQHAQKVDLFQERDEGREGAPAGQPVRRQATSAEGSASPGETSSLIHLNVYGIAALYEKFPTRPPTQAAQGGGVAHP